MFRPADQSVNLAIVLYRKARGFLIKISSNTKGGITMAQES